MSRMPTRTVSPDDYSTVTEVPGNLITLEALEMLRARYGQAARLGEGKDVLEVACGAGMGLGWLQARARRVVGGDFTDALLRQAQRQYGSRVPLLRLDAHALPFLSRSFDLVILYEAAYYLRRPDLFVAESRRVLREGGLLLVCTVNREWPAFNPSPHSWRYLSAAELRDLLEAQGYEVDLFGAFPVRAPSRRARVVALIKPVAVALGVVPRTMKGKQWLKRVFLGRLVAVPAALSAGTATPGVLVPLIGRAPVTSYKVLYAIGRPTAHSAIAAP